MPEKLHVKKGDTVVVINGKYKGKVSKVLTALPQEGKVVVQDVNIVTKHKKPTSATQQGGLIKQEAPIPSSKVMLWCDDCKRPTRIRKKVLADGSKVRVCIHCGREFTD